MKICGRSLPDGYGFGFFLKKNPLRRVFEQPGKGARPGHGPCKWSKIHSRLATFLVVLAGSASCLSLHAQTYTWTGANGTAWSDSANWSPAGVPDSRQAVVVFNSSGNGSTVINLANSPEIEKLVFDSASAAPYVLGLSGQQLSIANGGSVTLNAGVDDDQTIAANISLGTPYFLGFDTYWTNNSTANLTVSGESMNAGGNGQNGTLYLQGSGTGINTINTAINDNDAELGIWVQGTNTWQLFGANTFGGGVQILSGTLVVNSIADAYQASSIGSSSTDASNFRIATNANGTLRYVGSDATTNKNWSIGGYASITATFDIVANTLTMNGSCNTYSTDSSLLKTGNGTLALNGSNEYKGATIISQGVLSANTIANGGENSSIGKSSAEASNLVFDGGTLQYTGGSAHTNRGFTITDGKMAVFDIANGSGVEFSGNVGPTTGGISLIGGSLLLSGYNQYTGPTFVSGSGSTLIAGSNSATFGGPLGLSSDITLTAGATLSTETISNLVIGSLSGEADTQVYFNTSNPAFGFTINSSNSATFAGVITSVGGIIKQGNGIQSLTGGNLYQGATLIQSGGITLSGANGTITSSSRIGISGGATLLVENFGSATNTNRIGDTAGVTLDSGTLRFTSDAATGNFSETMGALVLAGGTNTVSNAQAASGLASSLTFTSLARNGSATVNFMGDGLGFDERNRIFFTTAPTLGDWAIYNGVGYAAYDPARGIIEALYEDVTRGSSGQKLIYNAPEGNIRVIDGTGTPGPIGMGTGGITNIRALVQSATDGPVAVNVLNGETFQAMSVLVGAGAGALTIGSSPNTGNFSSSDQALNPDLRRLSLINNSTNPLAVNSTITNAYIYGGPMAIALEKLGNGTVFLAGNNTYTGVTTIGQGVLSISTIGDGGMAGGLGTAPGAASSLVFAGGALHYTGNATTTNRAFTVNGTGSRLDTDADLHFSGNNTIELSLGSLTVGGTGNTTFTTVLAGSGALDKDGASTLTLQGVNSFTGGVSVRGGAVSVSNIGFGGAAGNLGAASSASANIVLDGGELVYTGASGITDRGLTIQSRGGTLRNSSTGENLVFENGSGNDIEIHRDGVFTVDGPGWVTIQSDITGPGALRKSGTGVLQLQNPVNLFTGGVTFGGGITSVASISDGGQPGFLGAASADPANLLFDGGTLAFNAYSSATNSTNRGFSIGAGKTAVIQVGSSSNLLFSGNVTGSDGGLQKTGGGSLILSGNLSYTGPTTVGAGTLVIDGSMSAGGHVTVESGATLGGSGTINRSVTINGTHSPGNSPGLQTFEEPLYYNAGSNVVWELAASTTAGRGVNYDGIDGALTTLQFTGPTTLTLVFDNPGSSVKWSDSLWSANRQWVIYSNFLIVGFEDLFGNYLTLNAVNWADSEGTLFNNALPDSEFSLARSGNDILLNYTGVPEPSLSSLLCFSAVALGFLRHRRRAR